jgi:putative SOS response-associated peptidase YedK
MCGRFSIAVPKEKIEKAMPQAVVANWQARYNIAPTQKALVLTNREPQAWQQFEWGLVPSWSKDGKNTGMLINARMETLEEKPSFRDCIRRQRCLVAADSFYEWKTVGKQKTPYRILLKDDDAPLFFGGIWDLWHGSFATFSIITTIPNAEMATIHNRMPVILRGASEREKWLSNATDLDSIKALCQQPADDFLKIYRISDKVNSVKNEGSDLHQAVAEDLTLW